MISGLNIHMKKFFLLLCILPHFVGVGQDTFLKEIINTDFFGESSIIATNDNGWLILDENSLQLTKFNTCGDIQWSKTYDMVNQNCCIGNQIVVGASGEIYLLSRQQTLQNTGYVITALSSTGLVLWSKLYAESGIEYYPYSLLMDPLGDLLVFTNITGGGTGYSTLTKLDINGTIKWSQKYDDSGTWGEAILTQDLGVLMRRGDEFIKVDSAGALEWATRVTITGTYYYRAPVEVSDGYIFTKQIQGSVEVGFYKLDKQGDLLWNGGRYTPFSGSPNPLRNTPNGNFTTVLNTNTNSPTASAVIIEFDKDLNIVQQNAISLQVSGWFLNDIWFTSQDVPLIIGKYDDVNIQHVVFGKLNADYTVGCDTVITTTFTDYPGTSAPETVGVSTNAITSTDVSAVGTDANLTEVLICSDSKVRVVTLANDTVICSDTSLTLQNLSGDNFSNFVWSTGETTPTITVNTSGTYWLEATTACSSTSQSDTVRVEVTEIQDPNLTTDTVLCGDHTILLDAEVPLGQYLWQDNSISSTYLVTQPGDYYVAISVDNCVQRFESKILACEEFIIPNIFTPNGDGVNDYFKVLYFGSKAFECQIYNRWGILLFESNTVHFEWDGTVNGKSVSDGVYMYLIKIGDQNLKGTLTILRK